MKKNRFCTFLVLAAALCVTNFVSCGKSENTETETPGTITPDSISSGDLSFDYTTSDLSPYVTLGNYEGLHGTLTVETITEARLDEELEALANQYGHYDKITDRAVAEGDTVIADFAGTLDGVAFDGGTATEQEITVQSDSGYIPGFAEAFIGQNVGEEFSFNVTFPENYHNADMAGQNAVFTCTVHYICGDEWIVPDINDSFVQEYFNYNNLEEFKISYRASLEANARYIGENTLYVELWEQILNNSEILAYPDGAVESQYNSWKEMYTAWADYYGVSYEDFLTNYVGTTDEAILEECRSYVREDLVMYALTRALDHTLSDEEFQSRLQNLAAAYGMTADNMLAQYEESSLRKTLLWESLMQKIADMSEITEGSTELAVS